MAQEFKNLFSPLKIGSMTTRNRIYSSPHSPGYIDLPAALTSLRGITLSSLPSKRMVQYWVAKAKGGVGMIGTHLVPIHPDETRNAFREPNAVEAFERSADAVHEHGAKLICQLADPGAQIGGYGTPVAWAPSAVITSGTDMELNCPHEMTRDEVRDFIDAFTHASEVCKEAGADGVEFQGAHGYLLAEFMSPHFNIRTDEYGGSLENRMRFPLEVIGAVREAVGGDFVIGMRISADEFNWGGYTLDDMLIMAPMLVEAGLDFLNVGTGSYVPGATAIEPNPLSSFVYCAAAIKQVVDVPVFARGRIQDPIQAEEILANNQADGVSMVRAIIADPEWPNKAREGRVDEIGKCLACDEGCYEERARGRGLRGLGCAMNPAVGREGEPGWGELIPAEVKKRVMIIGGGPAGLETARVATLRGHQVSLYDKNSELGGQTLIAAKAPGREGWLDLSRYQTYQMKQLNVDIHLNTEVTPEMVKEEAPDVVVVATGAVPLIPNIPGIDGDNVVNAWQVLEEEVEVGDNVVIIGYDEGMQSLSTADFLAERGKKVELLTLSFYFGGKIEPCSRDAIHQRLFQEGVVLTPNTGVAEISGNTVVAYNRFSGEQRRIDGVDTVVIACGGKDDRSLYYTLKEELGEIPIVVGDANGIRKVNNATLEGAILGRTL